MTRPVAEAPRPGKVHGAGAFTTTVCFAVVVSGLAAYTGYQLSSGAPRTQSLGPLVVVAGLGLLLLAVTRFAVFVAAVLALRSSLDIAKAQGSLDVTRQPGDPAAATWLEPGTVLGALFVVAAVTWLVIQDRRTPNPGPAGVTKLGALPGAGVALVGAGALGLLGSQAPAVAVGELLRVITAVLMICVVARLVADRPAWRPLILGAVLIAAVPPILATAVQVGTGSGAVDVHGTARPAGTLWHPNMLGVFSALLLVMTVALVVSADRRARPWPVLPIAGLAVGLVFTLVMSGTRGAWLAALAGLVVVSLVQDRRVLYGSGVVVLGVLALMPSVRDRVADLGRAQAASRAPESSLTWRFEHWERAFELFSGDPVIGVGLGGAERLLGKELHNDYLRALVETGVIGFAAYLAFLTALVLTARRALAATSFPPSAVPAGSLSRGIAVGFAGCTAVAIVFALADNLMTSVVVMVYLGAFAGLAAQLGKERP